MTEPERRRAAMVQRLALVQRLLWAHDHYAEIEAIVAASADRREAAANLTAARFGLTAAEVEHVLDLPLATRTRSWRAAMAEEVEALRAAVAELDADNGSP